MSSIPRGLRLVVYALALLCACAVSTRAFALDHADLRGVVHDPGHRPIAGAAVSLQPVGSAFHLQAASNAAGAFQFTAVPFGQYRLRVQAPGFAASAQVFTLQTGQAPVVHVQLSLASVASSLTVRAEDQTEALNAGSPATTSIITRQQIDAYAGADLTDSLRMITEFVPGATLVHDQLHVRGGHQVTWAIDGVPLPNTNIATNVGPQFSPRDIDSVEAQTGGYSAAYGDRTYGVFNVATRTGFELNRDAELVTTYGNYKQTDDQLSLGDHSERAAYYVSLAGNRTGYALEPPTAVNLHNAGAGGSGFTSLVFNRTPADQLRFDGAFRADYYQVPNDPDEQAAGQRDREREQDGFGIFAWTHTFAPGLLAEVAPFYHFNRAAYVGGPNDVPSATDDRASNYEGGQALVNWVAGPSNLRAGVYAFAQQDTTLFRVSNNAPAADFTQTVQPQGRVVAAFFEDQYRVRPWLTLSGGLRATSFSGNLAESAWDPRAGASLILLHLGWIARGSYGLFYQAPPLDTVSGPVLAFAGSQQLAFLPLHGERDEQHDVGLTIPIRGPLRGWTADFDQFRTGAKNYFDHDAIGNSDIFLPLTVDRARIAGWEARLHSPLLAGNYRAHLVFSNQQAEGFGAVTGGLTDFSPPAGGFYLDHDQRNTLSAGAEALHLPARFSGSLDVNYGSGFLNGDGPAHLPQYATLDLSLARSFGESLTARFAATNVTGTSYQLDLSNTFGGSHYGDPRMLYGELRWRVHY